MTKLLRTLGHIIFAFAPLAVMAQATPAGTPSGSTFQSILQYIIDIVKTLIPFMLALALLAFFWGLVQYIWKSGDAEAQAAGKGIMTWGIIALFVMVAVWGLVNVIAASFSIGTGGTAVSPRVNVTP